MQLLANSLSFRLPYLRSPSVQLGVGESASGVELIKVMICLTGCQKGSEDFRCLVNDDLNSLTLWY